MKSVKVRIVGTTALLMHNIDAANPLAPHSAQMAKLHEAKRRKGADTIDILRQIADLEFETGMYYSADNNGPFIPAYVIERCIRAGASLVRKGKDVTRAVQLRGHFVPLDYDGPRTMAELKADHNFRYATMVAIQKAKVLRTRPMFSRWSCRFEMVVDERRVTVAEALSYLTDAGIFEGIGDGRTMHFGRFTVEA